MPRNFQPLTLARPAKDDDRSRPRKVGTAVISNRQPVGKSDVRLLRTWADRNEWIRGAIDHRKKQVGQAKFDITAIDPLKPVDEEMRLRILSLFSRPNLKTDDFRGFIEPVVEDIMVLDAGSIEIQRNRKNVPLHLWQVDGATIRLDPTWAGENPKAPRYFWFPQTGASLFGSSFATVGQGVGILDDELIYMMENPATWRVTGFSKLETLRETIESEIAASRYNKSQVQQAPPHGIIDLGEDATPENVDQFEKYWRSEIAGQKSTAVIGGTKGAKFTPFAKSNRDMQFLQWQTYLIRKITTVFGISPQDLGVTFDVNRANAAEQGQMSEDRGIRPLMHLIESHLNREVVAEFGRTLAATKYYRGDFDMKQRRMAIALSYLDPRIHPDVFAAAGDANAFNLQFHFLVPSSRSITTRTNIHKAELGNMPWRSINDVRAEELLPPVENGDDIIVNTPMGPIPLKAITGDLLNQQSQSPEDKARVDAFLELMLGSVPWRLTAAKPTESSTPPENEG